MYINSRVGGAQGIKMVMISEKDKQEREVKRDTFGSSGDLSLEEGFVLVGKLE
jgi:hypothetical protein